MSDDQNNNGGWQPHPQGEYDSDATAFVQLPEGALDSFDHSPLAAPGHGYVPPQITVNPTTAEAMDPAATGVWVMPPEVTGAAPGAQDVQDVQWPAAATGQWNFHEGHEAQGHDARGHEAHGYEAQGHVPAPAPASADVTGEWSIPVANGDLPDESGEFTASSLATQWGGTPPATLPGGAAAPWATGGAGAGAPWSEQVQPQQQQQPPYAEPQPHEYQVQHEAVPAPEAHVAPEVHEPHVAPEEPAEAHPEPEPAVEPEPEPEPAFEAEPAVEAELETEPEADAEAEPEPDAEVEPEADPEPEVVTTSALSDEHPLCSYVLRVNGADRPVTDAWIGESLLYVLRERLGLAGAKDGCSQGECGACNVQVDGRLVASCLVPAATAAGSEVRTVEGLATDGRPSDVQRALANCGAVQCGFCVPGMAMTVHDLLEGNPAPTDLEARRALCGNLCRCSGYRGVLDAVQEVVAEREASAAAAEPSGHSDGEARIPHQAGPGAGGVNPAAQDGSYEGPYGQDGGQA
ncbi:2Fe-2S iron-sulfur cluster-binding protein [Streptomyces sp. NPDC048436]|uniref:(2Fe-2S)-binding protein n=1 Tax=Streptomyces sp. NPDC048436 TaxID=3365550 RepID=UPI00371E9A10